MTARSVSLCMIVKNEEKYIEKCLESVKEFVDEIIIVDTGSSDATLEIARKYTDAVYNFEWTHDFAAARNFSIKNAKSDYILMLDADEYLDGHFIDKETLTADMYLVKIKNYLSYGYAVNHTAFRLFRNDKRFMFKNRIHEHLNIDEIPDLKYESTGFTIHHTGYLKDTVAEKSKDDRNLKLLIKEVKENPTGYAYFNLGTHYKIFGKHLDAIEAFQKAYALSKGYNFLPKLILGIAECLIELERNQEALNVLNDAVIQFPQYTDFYYMMGLAYENMEHFNDAEFCFKTCLELGEVENSTVASYEGVGSYLAMSKLANIKLIQGDRAKAISLLGEAVYENKHHMQNLSRFFELNFSLKNEEMLSYMEKLFPIHNEKDVNTLLKVLYSLRSPLLKQFMDKYVGKTDPLMVAISKQYSGDYEASKTDWLRVTAIGSNNVPDLILISFILKDRGLFDSFKDSVNFSDKENEIIDRLINRKKLEETVKSKMLEEQYLFLCKKLILLGEFNEFQYLFEQSHAYSKKIQFALASLLYEMGFIEVAMDLANQIKERTDTVDWALERFIGDLWMAVGNYQNALSIYNKNAQYTNEFADLERIYNLYKQVNYKEGCDMIIKIMLGQGYQSIWLDSLRRG